jgi:hypothetical protein
MYRPRLRGQALRLGLLVTLLVLALSACGGGEGSQEEEESKARPLLEVEKTLRSLRSRGVTLPRSLAGSDRSGGALALSACIDTTRLSGALPTSRLASSAVISRKSRYPVSITLPAPGDTSPRRTSFISVRTSSLIDRTVGSCRAIPGGPAARSRLQVLPQLGDRTQPRVHNLNHQDGLACTGRLHHLNDLVVLGLCEAALEGGYVGLHILHCVRAFAESRSCLRTSQ